jgi:hypothetical protein
VDVANNSANITGNFRVSGAGAGNLVANNIVGNVATVTFASVTSANIGTANIAANGNATFGFVRAQGYLNTAGANVLYGNSNVFAYLSSNSNIILNIGTGNISTAGFVTAGGNVTAAYFIGNGSQLTGLPASYGNANVAAYLPTYTGNLASLAGNVTTTANVSAAFVLGNGAFLTGIASGGSSYSNANVAAYLPVYNGSALFSNIQTTTANITGSAQFANVANLLIPGGTLNQVMKTDGNGNISFGDVVATPGNNVGSFQYNNDANLYGLDDFTYIYTGNVDPRIQLTNLNFTIDKDTSNANVQLTVIGNIAVNESPSDANTGYMLIGGIDRLVAQDLSGNAYTGQFVVVDGNAFNYANGYANANVVAYAESGWAGNIIPAANATYSLGSASNQWSNLWVANNTIYLGNVPLGITTGNVLTVNGNAVLSNGSSTSITTTGNITGGNLNTTGNLIFSPTQVQSSAYAGGQGHAMMIDTNRTDTYVEIGSADKPFKTFAAAIAAVATLNPTGTVPYTFILMGCNINETVDFTPYNFNFITISTTCRSVFNNPVIFGNSALLQLTVRNVEFGNTVTITGDGTTNQLNNTSFYNVSFTGAVTVTAANALAFYEAAFFSTVTFNNVNYCYVNGAQFNDDWTIRVDNSGAYPIPSGGAAPGVVLALDFIANDINFVKGGTGAGVFQPHSSRMGRTGQTYTLPSGWILTAYSSAFLGNWVNDGTWTMRNSVNVVTIANTAPTYSGTIGGTTITATGNITGGNLTLSSSTGNITGHDITLSGAVSATGNITGGNIITTGNITGNTAGFAIGYRDIPQVSFIGNATIATADAGKHFYSTQSTDYILTIANNASQGFQTGAAITVINQGTGNITLAQGSGVTLYLTGNATSGNRTVTTFGMATLIKVATDTWFASGSGVI